MMLLRLEHESVSIALRPSYGALVAAEEELGSLFALVERATGGALRLSEMVALLWHCRCDDSLSRAALGDLCVAAGLAKVTPLFRQLLEAAFGGQH
jgi:Phage tail tube protein, GTA-gp10